MKSKGLGEALDGREHFSLAANEQLWLAIPEMLRQVQFTAVTVPPEHLPAFSRELTPRSGIKLDPLPEEMQRELAWCIFRLIELGGVVCVTAFQPLIRRLVETLGHLARTGSWAPRSLMELPLHRWEREMTAAISRRTGKLPAPVSTRNTLTILGRCYRLLWLAYDTRPWWQREIWDPRLDARIPRRAHEPKGNHSLQFHRIGQGWLRLGAQWHFKVCLETGELTWSTLRHRLTSLVVLDGFFADRRVTSPWLKDEPAEVRVLMLDFLGYLRQLPARAGAAPGRPLSALRVTDVITDVERFYAFMTDHRETASRALGEPGWLRLGPQHAAMFRRGEKPRPPVRPEQPTVIDDTALSKIMANVHILGDPIEEGGFGDEQAMRALMLLVRTGRRVSEILMLDRDPLLPLDGLIGAGGDEGDGLVAKLRYQQTKIDGAPDTIFVDDEVVAIIKAQQEWADRLLVSRGLVGVTPKYLFLAHRMNRRADRPYTVERLVFRLDQLVQQLDIRDGQGRLVDFSRTHRFRHTRATTLLNAGVPIHVVQRYLGHLSPTMTMIYAETLASTHEREFLRYKKIGSDGRELEVDPRDLYDMLELNRRADRILPNGWCMLPPRQVCTKGNACLTCDKFATDASYLPELRQQLERTTGLIDERKQAFLARTGQEMGEDNIWVAGRRQEQEALRTVILTIGKAPGSGGAERAVRGAGVGARHQQILGTANKGS